MKLYLTALYCVISFVLFSQDFYDIETIQTIEITFSESNWDQLMDNAYATTEDYIVAQSIAINGVTYDSIGVKYKGNSSYNANQIKNPWHIELNTYKDHEHEGFTDIKLANGYKDPSMIREVLAYEILRNYMVAPKANFAKLYVNGQFIGVYTNTESISKKFMESRFGSKDHTRFKCSPPEGAGPQSDDFPNLVYLGQDSSQYYGAYEIKSDYGWDELIDLCDTLENHITSISEILDVDRTLWMLAFDNILVNLDSYIGRFAQNYYLYRGDYQQFYPIVWDLNESFGVFSQTGTSNLQNTTAKQQMDYLLHDSEDQYPLVSQLLSVPRYKRQYVAHYKTIWEEHFENGSYVNRAIELQNFIEEAVQEDQNKFYTNDQFTTNLTSDVIIGGGPGGGSVPGITNLMDGRSTYLMSQSDFSNTTLEIFNVEVSNSSPQLQDIVYVNATIAGASDVYLGFRDKSLAPFQKVSMFDDGLHNDGLADDGVYGVDIQIQSVFTEFYVYAENEDVGIFSPVRAEFEFYEISAISSPQAGVLVINELLASNATIQEDQDNEFDDWVELYNNSSESLDLSGYFLSDDETDLTKWSIPNGTIIGANDYLIIWTDGDVDQSGLHASFKLSASGESLLLSSPMDTSIIDVVDFGSQLPDISYGRIPNGVGGFELMNPSFNSENMAISSTQTNESQLIKIFPNPSSTEFHIISESFQDEILIIYNLNGQVQFQEVFKGALSITTGNWLPGVYLYSVGELNGKLIVIH